MYTTSYMRGPLGTARARRAEKLEKVADLIGNILLIAALLLFLYGAGASDWAAVQAGLI